MYVIAFNSECENEASQDEGDDVIHVRVRNAVSGSNSKEREEKERAHGGDRKRHGSGHPPTENPRDHGQHLPAAGGRAVEVDKETY